MHVLAIGAVCGCSAQAQSLIANGSFELPPGSANAFENGPPTDWTTGSEICFISNWAALPAEDGKQFVVIGTDSGCYVAQTFTVVNPGQYALTWYDNSYNTVVSGEPAATYAVSVTGAAQTLLNQIYQPGEAAYKWTAESVELNLTPGSYTLEFQAQSYYSMIDNVSLVATVPEPSTLALFTSAGAAGLLAARRRKS